MSDNADKQILFDRFRIEECLKKDTVSSVFSAWHIHLDKKILLKTLNASEIDDREWLERFRREAKVLARLDHPNIIRILDFGSDKTVYYISFEYFESRNLRQIFQRKTLSHAQKREILIQLLRGLDAAHHNGIIHRDVKPENILANDDLKVKLADFGLAFTAGESKLTSKTSLIGTPAYMSPEQIRGERLNEKTDLFSAGIVAFEMFRGYHPFLGRDVKTTINNILSFDHRSIAEKLSADDPHVIADLLQSSPSLRPSSAGNALEKLGISPDENRKNQSQKTKRGKKVYQYAVIIFLIIFLVFTGYILYPDPDHGPANQSDKIPESLPNELTSTDTIAGVSLSEKEKKLSDKIHESGSASDQASGETTGLKSGNLFLFSDPASDVYIDFQYQGKSPFRTPLKIPAGRHLLKLTHERFPDYLEEIEIGPGQTRIIDYNLDTLFGYLSCQIYPWGMVLVDGKLIGETPLPQPALLTPGKHLITIENPGYQALSDSLVIVRQETTFYRVNLKKRDGQN
ncbi:MAG: serine/threonine protein kinase [Calditrichia bacterium]|nr:serine/threonine protein kinase [Calditrichia bacterium]